MVLGVLVRNKMMGLIVLFLFGLVWSSEKGSYYIAQAVLQLTIAQAALKFLGILFFQSPSPV